MNSGTTKSFEFRTDMTLEKSLEEASLSYETGGRRKFKARS